MDCNNLYSSKPEVDETTEKCSEITSTDCITTPIDNLYLRIFDGDSLTEVIEKLIDKLQTLENRQNGI